MRSYPLKLGLGLIRRCGQAGSHCARRISARELTSHSTPDEEFPDDRQLFSQLTMSELASAYANLAMASNKALVGLAKPVLAGSKHVGAIASPVWWSLKHTSFAHFCAGTSLCRYLEAER